MPIVNVCLNVERKLGAITAYVQTPYVAICYNTITLSAAITGNSIGHSFLWTQLSGTPVTWLTALNGITATFTESDSSTKQFKFVIDGTQTYYTTVFGSPTENYPGAGTLTANGLSTESYNWQTNSHFNLVGIPSQLATNIQYSPQVNSQSLGQLGTMTINPSLFTIIWTAASLSANMTSNDLLINTSGTFSLNTSIPYTSSAFSVSNLSISSSTTFRIRSNYKVGGIKSSATTNSFFPSIPNNAAVTDASNTGGGTGFTNAIATFTNYSVVNQTTGDTSNTGSGTGFTLAVPTFTNYSLETQTPGDYSNTGSGTAFTRYYGYTVVAGGNAIGG